MFSWPSVYERFGCWKTLYVSSLFIFASTQAFLCMFDNDILSNNNNKGISVNKMDEIKLELVPNNNGSCKRRN